MNSDLVILLTTAPMFLLALFLGLAGMNSGKRKRKNVYGFFLPGWQMVRSDETLYQIELIFKEGVVFPALELDEHVLGDWHSNIRKKGTEIYSGYISGHRHEDDTIVDQRNWRYFLCFLPVKGLPLERSYSGKLLKPEHKELDELLGTGQWDLIIEDDVFVVLAPEMFDLQQLEKFLALCERLRLELAPEPV